MPVRNKYPQARWFDQLGSCVDCGRPAHGHLMSFRNDKIGTFCKVHGEAAVRVAQAYVEAARARADKETKS